MDILPRMETSEGQKMKYYNSDIAQDFNLKFNPKGEYVDNKILDVITPTIEIKPRIFVKSNTLTNQTTLTIITTDSTRDTYLVGVSLSVIKDVTAVATIVNINGFVDGTSQRIVSIQGITLTPQSEAITMSFPYPIKIDKGTVINIATDNATANIKAVGVIHFYTQDTSKGN
jgi:hypothetical protein